EHIRSIRLRPGMQGSTVVVLQLKPGLKVPVEEIRVELGSAGAKIRLPFAARVEVPSSEAPRRDASEATQTPILRAEPTAPSQQPSGANSNPVDSTDRSPSEAPAPAVQSGRDLTSTASGTSLNIGLLLLITALLGIGYLVMRYLQKSNPLILERPEIELLASRRLGTKHQLVLVRALGEDHLLSIQGNATTRLSSLPAGPGEAHQSHNKDPSRKNPGSSVSVDIDDIPIELPTHNLLSKLRKGVAKGIRAQNDVPKARVSEQESDSDPNFGTKLMKLAEAQRKQSIHSEAVAGLIKLRRAAGK
ncbi:MAG: flagellar biosynthetic protein FliO, partial [Myxococcota bacterium]